LSRLAALAIALVISSPAMGQTQQFRMDLSAPILFTDPDTPDNSEQDHPFLSLRPEALPNGTVGQPWEFDFSTLTTASSGLTNLQWSTRAEGLNAVPPGLTMESSNGVLAGTPLLSGEYSFEVVVDADEVVPADAIYTILVDGSEFRATKVAVGNGHMCAISVDGELYCWGGNSNGTIGDGTTTNRSSPVHIDIPGTVRDIAVSAWHSCAVTTTDQAYCWGNNSNGRLGLGTKINHYTPQLLPISGIKQLSVSTYTGCALLNSGGVRCWGNNGPSGRLGNNSTTESLAPVTPNGLNSGVISLSVGEFHACALLESGGLSCWGSNSRSQLGVAGITSSPVPIPVFSSGVKKVLVGDFHTCVITTSNAMRCVGGNNYSQSNGVNTTDPVESWTTVPGGSSGVDDMAVGGNTNCMLRAGVLSCWGRNNSGQTGRGNTENPVPPMEILSNVLAVNANANLNICAIMENGVLQCWGGNSSGQLSNGTTTPSYSPTPVFQ